MIGTLSQRVLLGAIALILPAAAMAQTLTLEVRLANLETSITNNSAAVIAIDGYQIQSGAGTLDPVTWQSIADSAASNPGAVTAALGSGALSFVEAGSVDSNILAELNFLSSGTWQPGTRWSIGFPFGTTPGFPLDAIFDYIEAGSSVIIRGPIIYIAVPEPAALSLVILALLGTAALRRNFRHAGETPGRAGG